MGQGAVTGYVPLFDSVLDGTLFGKWPHTGIWTCLLSQVNQHGEIDMNPALLAAKIGVPVDMLLTCIHDFMQPDPGSRTKDHDGRRLELIDPNNRDWGWRVINHSKYREKARLKAKAQREVESGQNAARMADRRGPPDTAPDPLSTQRNASQLNAEAAHASPTPEGELAVVARNLGVSVKSTDPVLHAWVRDGFSIQQLRDAVSLARIRKPTGAIPANYLDPILREPPKPPPKPQHERVTWRPPPDEATG
jgi:hypothetical protein